MPKEAVLELEDETLEDEAEDVLEEETEELIEDEGETTTSPAKKTKRTKRTMDPANVYLFDDADAAKAGANELKYSDGSKVDGFRVWDITKTFEEEEKEDKQLIYVLSRGQYEASHRFLEHKNYTTTLKFKKDRGGSRGPRKIASEILMFAKMCAQACFVGGKPNGTWLPDTGEQPQETWKKSFGENGTFAHYLDENNNWKETTDK